MGKTAESMNSNWFFEDLAAARNRVLLLDYDGTIAPFSADRKQALPYPAIPPLLKQILGTCRTRVIIITGGSAHRIAPLLGIDPGPETLGTYGLERLYPDGRYAGVEINDAAFDALVQAEVFLGEEGLRQWLQVSPAAVAIHWRGLSPSEVLEIRSKAYRILNPLASQTGLVLADFDGGVEIRVPSASTGDAVRNILSEIDDSVPLAYLGDDTPDEDAFRALIGRGLTALVRPKYRFTAAQMWLRPPDDLVRFLNEWIKACGGDA